MALKWPIMRWCAVKKLLTHSLTPGAILYQIKNQTRRTCSGHNRTVITGRKGHSKEMNEFYYGGDFRTAAVNLAVHPITDTPVVAPVIPAPVHSWNITNSTGSNERNTLNPNLTTKSPRRRDNAYA